MGVKARMVISVMMLMVVMVHWDGAKAQSGCTMAIVSLSPCMNYVTGNSSTPSSSCCSRLSSVVTSQPQCLCSLLKGGASNFGIVVNQTLALTLPGACNVQTPPLSRCDGSGAPVAAPAPADSDPSESPDDEMPEDVPSGGGSKTVPGTDGSSIGGSSNGSRATLSLIFIASSWLFSSAGIM